MSERSPNRPEKRLIPHPTSREEVAKAPQLSRDIRKQVVGQYRDLLREAEAARAMVRRVHGRREELLDEVVQLTGMMSKAGAVLRDKEKVSSEINEKKDAIAKVEAELGRWLQTFARQKWQIDALRAQHGKSLERAHRAWVKEGLNSVNFRVFFGQLAKAERAVKQWRSTELEDNESSSGRKKQAVARQMERGEMTTIVAAPEKVSAQEMVEELEDAVDFIFSTNDPVSAVLKKEIEDNSDVEKKPESPPMNEMSLSQLKRLHRDFKIECEEAWVKPGVQHRWFEREFHGWVAANLRGDRVFEFPSVVQTMNELEEIEKTYTNTTIGGVLVGEPGVGKTTLINHFLEKKGRKAAVYIDMSEEVTRYQLFGAPSLQTESSIDQFRRLAEMVGEMGDEDVVKLVREHAKKLAPSFDALSDEECEVMAFRQLQEQLGEGGTAGMATEKSEEVEGVRDRLEEIVRKQFRSEVAKKMVDLTKKNGWRDGIVIHALRNDFPLIIDEFNKAKSWTLLHKLTETAPGTAYYFADNNETIEVPEDWRMYFTANIGKKFGTFGVREAFASRIGGKAMEIKVPPSEEERTAMLSMICDDDDRFLRPPEDVVHLMYFVRDIVPKIRAAICDQRNIIPISYRLFRDLAEQLVDYKHGRARDITLDQALLKVLIRPYVVFETKEIPRDIVKLCFVAGLLLGPEVEKEVMGWSGLSKDDLAKMREEHAKGGTDAATLLAKFRESDEAAMTQALPLISQI